MKKLIIFLLIGVVILSLKPNMSFADAAYKPWIASATTNVDTLSNGGDIILTIIAKSNAPVNWFTRSFDGPNGNIYGGGSAVTFQPTGNPDEWIYTVTYSVSEWAPSGNYTYSGMKVANEGDLWSDVYNQTVTVYNSNVDAAYKPWIASATTNVDNLINGGDIILTIITKSNAPIRYIYLTYTGPNGVIEGGGHGTTFFQPTGNPDEWIYTRTFTISHWAPSGNYTFSNLKVENEGYIESDVHNQTLTVFVNNSGEPEVVPTTTPPPTTAPAPKTVCPIGCDYTTIEQALSKTTESTTIYVQGGTYKESIRINGSKKLIGQGAIIDSTTIMCCGTVRIRNSEISGFTIITNPNAYGISIYDNSIVTNNTIMGATYYKGIEINGVNNTVTNNIVKDCARGIVHMTKAKNNTVTDNQLINIAELHPPTPKTTAPPTTPPPQKIRIIVLANSIDYGYAESFLVFLDNIGIEVVHSTATEFDQYKEEKFIVILGGPDAYEGVGEIVQGILSEDEQNTIREKGARKKYVKIDPWGLKPGQRVTVVAGSDRHETKNAEDENKDSVVTEAESSS